MFDQWDHALQSGHDTEYPLVVLALCIGAAFVLAGLIVKLSPNLAAASSCYRFPSAMKSFLSVIRPSALAFGSVSPPLSLRI
jgi:hypothetical protein